MKRTYQAKKEAKKSLKEGRPPLASKPQATLSKKKTQKLIRSHHDMNKQLATAKAKGDEAKAGELKKRIDEAGGLKTYQLASIQGQSKDRGGDTSIVLVDWMKDCKKPMKSSKIKLRMLEVGALSMDNACAGSRMFDIQRIDLNSQAAGILHQDFMERKLPQYEKEQFDVISLSLVLNFVPTTEARGEMLKRTCKFLDQRAPRSMPEDLQDSFPVLFLVLPASCVVNSRYLNDELLTVMMDTLGYVCLRRKQTDKLVYYLWLLRDKPAPDKQIFPKKEIRPGGDRNNFAIVLKK
jgi:25S rRNA (adenine2142-N1)-methyltransferase